ncbi:UDP-glucose:undecaprenyl-phosphate glucose-1-phosphate transferase [Pontiella desulfatans]|uniref:UDP-glucose:undecaprenyl-phosphate glucose-1-phosphate transferase n=2 Tax=Pontiella desulfatans TaxID=2750659 RepID=A0A6C2TWW7_PONDE|nr:UDP-glucose:undecaprenyl-phosphate glucose-1-phosphate transferase [Pontiella desulfatans]
MAFHQFWNSFWLLVTDSVILFAGLLLGNILLLHIQGIPVSIQYSALIVPVWWVGALVSGQAPGWGLGMIEELRRIELLLITVFGIAGVAYVLGQDRMLPSRIVYLSSYAFSAFLLPFGRIACRRLLGRLHLWGCNVALYGDTQAIERMVQVFKAEANIGYRPAGIFSDDLERGARVGKIPVLGGLHEASSHIGVAVASIAHLRKHDLVDFVDHDLAGYRKVVLFPDINERVFAWVTPRDFNGLVGLEVSRNLLVPIATLVKRIYETMLVLLFLPVWLPLVGVLALVLFCTDGKNPFYSQSRIGKTGQSFKAIKLRTMVPKADQVLQDVLDQDEGARREWETYFKLKTDPRITPVGRFLRRFSLDELPQLFNVLAGEMALVGPRPLPDYHQEELPEKARLLRGKVRPGMTGQWQVSGRSDCSLAEMELWDNFYVRNWSVWMDIYIMARTVRVVFFPLGAY